MTDQLYYVFRVFPQHTPDEFAQEGPHARAVIGAARVRRRLRRVVVRDVRYAFALRKTPLVGRVVAFVFFRCVLRVPRARRRAWASVWDLVAPPVSTTADPCR